MSDNSPNIPAIPASVDSSVRRAFDELKRWFAGTTRRGGALTRQDMIDAGVIAPGGGSGFEVPIPPQLDLTAVGGFAQITLTYTDLSASPYLSHYEIFRATVNDVGQAAKIGSTDAPVYPDTPPNASLSVTYYYWVRAVYSYRNVIRIGPYSNVASAATADDPVYMLEVLAGEITSSQLHTSLNTPIGQIPGILDDLAALQGQVNSLAGEIVGTVFVQPAAPVPGVDGVPDPIPDNSRWYDSDDNNHPYIWYNPGTGYAWQDLADPRIGINASDIDALEVRMTSAEGDISANASAISVLDTTVTNHGGTLSTHTSQITTLQSDLDVAETGISGHTTAISGLGTRMTAAEGSISTQAGQITALDARLDTAEGNITGSASAISALDVRVDQTESAISAQATQVSTLSTTVGGHTTSIQTLTTTTDGLSAQYTLKVDNNGFPAGYGLSSEPVNGIPFSQFMYLSDRFSIINPNVGAVSATITRSGEVATVVTGSAHNLTTGKYAVIVGANQREYNGAKQVTVVNATTFTFAVSASAVTPATGTIKVGHAVVPFVVDNGVVYIDTLLLKNGTIKSAQIESLAADKLYTPSGTLAEAIIGTGHITNAMIGNTIQSTSYVPGSSGWYINKNGTVEFNGGTFRGAVVFTGSSSGYTNLTDRPTNLAGINSTEGSKLSGIAEGADVTDYTDSRIANVLSEGNVLTVARPGGGSYSSESSNVIGVVKITLPQSWTNTMMRFWVDVFDYWGNKSFSLALSGYNYAAGAMWYQTSAQLVGNTAANNRVRFGHDGTKCCILIGETTSTWNYPKIVVRDFLGGYSNYSAAQWQDGWAVSITSDITGFTPSPGADYADSLLDAKAVKYVGTTLATTVEGNAASGATAWSKFSGAGNTLPAGNVEFNFAGSATKGGNATNTDNVGTQSAATVQASTINFNSRNDRNATAVVAPVIDNATGTIDHTQNTDGSVDVSFEWTWGGNEADIDGFIVYVHDNGTTTPTSQKILADTADASVQVFYLTPQRRAFILYGVAANHWYTFGVQAYRIVDPDIDATGTKKSAIVQPLSTATETTYGAYRPASSVAFAGDITGTIAGTEASTVVSNAASGANAWTRLDSWTKPSTTVIDGAKIETGTAWIYEGYIRDAVVTTLKIGANAVTVPVGASQVGTLTLSGTQTVVSLNAVVAHAQPVLIVASCAIQCGWIGGSNNQIYPVTVRLKRGSTVLSSITMQHGIPQGTPLVWFAPYAAAKIESPGIGTHTYSIETVSGGTNGQAVEGTLSVIMLQR